MTTLKDTLILSVMREDIQSEITEWYEKVAIFGFENELETHKSIKTLTDRILEIIVEASNKLENKK